MSAFHHKHPQDSERGGAGPASHAGTPPLQVPGAKQMDPVCGMNVSIDSAHSAEHAGQRYVFCSGGCRTKFIADPNRYVDEHGESRRAATANESALVADVSNPKALPASTVPASSIYTCPMHPEVRQVGPGNCPESASIGKYE
jgi:Cu+-exporting ATPase